ncbi:MAG: lipid kinase [Acetobacteraceae bacterium]|nr:lipid kinase [Pseudomonadota bacterium]
MNADGAEAPRPQTVLLLVNTRSRRGRSIGAEAMYALQCLGCTVISAGTSHGAKPAAVVRQHAGVVDAVALVGGDGTLNAAAPALLETGLPLLVIPAGTGNDLARTIGIPTDPHEAANLLHHGRLRRIDLGMVNDVPFFNVASIGFGVDLTRALTQDSKRRWGVLGYMIAAIRALSRLRPFTAWIVHGDETHVSRTVHVAIGNGRHYGGGMIVAEGARIDDGRLDIFSLEVSSVWGLLKLLPSLRSGRHHAWVEVRNLASESVEIRTRRRRSINTDGEITTSTPAVFRVLPRAIAVFVPLGVAAGREPDTTSVSAS